MLLPPLSSLRYILVADDMMLEKPAIAIEILPYYSAISASGNYYSLPVFTHVIIKGISIGNMG